ncbi:MAG: ABC transporter substrate-binding protein [Candidatus Humimicrobiaceae bacterium]
MKKTGFIFLTVLVLITLVFGVVIVTGCKPKAKAKLSIACFKGYAEEDWVKPFEEKYNATVEITYFGSVDEGFAKIKGAPDQYNIVSIDSGRVKLYYDAGLIKDIDTAKIENYGKIGEYFRTQGYAELEKGKQFHVPICWGDQDFVVNMETAGEDIKPYLVDIGNGNQALSYNVLKDAKLANRETIFDETTNVTNMAAISAGIKTPFALDDNGYAKMQEELTKWAQNCRAFTTGLDSELQVLTSGDAEVILTGNNSLVAMALAEQNLGDKFKHFLPAEGTICWIDGWALTKSTTGESLDLALKYMDYMIGDEGQQKLAKLVGFGIVNPAGASGFTDVIGKTTWWYSTSIDNFPVPLYVMVAEENPEKRVKVWTDIKASLSK